MHDLILSMTHKGGSSGSEGIAPRGFIENRELHCSRYSQAEGTCPKFPEPGHLNKAMTMTVESPELAAVARRWLIAQQDRDSETLVGLFSMSDHLRYIGTGHGESWAGDFIRQVYPEHSAEIPRFVEKTD
ncbi:MAG: hypothetical protein ACR2O8_11675 [Rhizobiaceae bacterium]